MLMLKSFKYQLIRLLHIHTPNQGLSVEVLAGKVDKNLVNLTKLAKYW